VTIKALAAVGWTCLALDALFVVMMFVTRNVGDDAAGRGMATGFGIVLTPIVLLAGAALWWAQRSGSLWGVLLATLFVGLPLLILAKNVAMGPVSAIERAIRRSGEGIFDDRVLTDLAAAIASGDTARVRTLAATPGLDFTARDRKGRTILGIAVKSATGTSATDAAVECVRLLVAAGAKYADDAIEENGRMFSDVVHDSGDRHARLMDLLLTAGANPNDTERWDARPLLLHMNMTPGKARVLLAHGASLDVRDTREDRPGWDPLMNAVFVQNWPLATFYLEQGLDPRFRATDGKTVQDVLLEKQGDFRSYGDSAAARRPDVLGQGYDAFVAALAKRRKAR
jgi:hypothetical protein